MEESQMKKTPTELLIDRLRNGEKITCPKCKMGQVCIKENKERGYPDVFCDNPKCLMRINYN